MCLEGGCGVYNMNISLKSRRIAGNYVPRLLLSIYAILIFQCVWPVYACKYLIITIIDGLGGSKNDYHHIQKTLYRFNGTQCEYCSLGMV